MSLELVRVHGQAHGTAGVAPFEARGLEDLVQPFLLGLGLDRLGPGYDKGPDAL